MKFKFQKSHFTFALIKLLGYPFYWFSKIRKNQYQIVIPAATYAPWHHDTLYNDVYAHVKKHSLINYYLGWELYSMVGQIEKIPGDILEVGVWRGSSSIIMGSQLAALKSYKTIYACDTFEGVVKANEEKDNFYKGGEHKDTSLQFVDDLIKTQFGLQNVRLLKGIFPEESQHLIADKAFSFCHIDVDTYDSAKEIMNWLWPRLSRGGMIYFNDFGFPDTRGITNLVNGYATDNNKVVLHNLNGHGIIVKVEN